MSSRKKKVVGNGRGGPGKKRNFYDYNYVFSYNRKERR